MPDVQRKHARGTALVVLTTVLWGSTFVVIKQTVRDVPASELILGRFSLAAAVFLPFLRRGRALWTASIELGLLLWGGYATQTIGLRYTTVGRSAFLTSAGVVLVPVYTRLSGRRVGPMVWPAAILSLAGVALLSGDVTSAPFNRGDAWTLACTAIWSTYIYRLERFAAAFDATALTATHLLVVAILSIGWAAGDGTLLPHGHSYPGAAVIYLGLLTTAATTWLQTLGQRWLPAARAAVLYTLEPVWASIFGWFAMGDRLGARGLCGAGMILAAACLAQVRAKSPGDAGV